MLEVKEIQPEMTYALRHCILRPHQSFEACKYDTDVKSGSFHVGAFYQRELISVASFCVEEHPGFSVKEQYRLRAMATAVAFRGIGAGRSVVGHAEALLKAQGTKLLWCNGRTSVQAYYEKLGFRQHGDVFDYPPIGPHVVMYKKLS